MPKIIVLEPTPLITSELQRFFLREDSVVIDWFSDCHLEIEFGSCELVVLNTDEEDDHLLSTVHLINEHSSAQVLVLVGQVDLASEAILRELGADAILPRTTQKSRICEVVCRLCEI